jgi:hypothetical protein
MKNILLHSVMILFFSFGLLQAGDVTITLIGINPLTINIKGDTQNEEAGNISLYLYFRDDGLTDLDINNVDASQITDTFGWGNTFETKRVETGLYNVGGYTFTGRLFYDNVDISGNDFWTITGINAIVCTFTTVGIGHAFIELTGSDGLTDHNGIPHNVSYANQEIPLPVKVPVNLEIPKSFKLHPNYPNPFNPTTTFQLDIPRIGAELVDTRLVIYNSVGQEIKALYQDKLSAGSYEVQWNGRTNFGKKAPSGIYFALFKANGFYQSRKLILLK